LLCRPRPFGAFRSKESGMDSSIIPYLFLVTFIVALALGVQQYRKARKAKREHHQSASARANGEAPARGAPRAE
jgi:hypothetical protein